MRLAVSTRLLDRDLHPADSAQIDAELMLEMSACPDRGGLGVERQADALAFEILGGADAGARLDEDVAVAKDPRRKHRQRDKAAGAAAGEADEFRGRQFCDIEFLPAHHAVEDFAARAKREAVWLDALMQYAALSDRLHPVLAPARAGQFHA